MCVANVDTSLIESHWDELVHLAASVMSGNASAVAALARFGSAARGDPVYEAGVQLGKLLRTAFLADYFVNADFRRELRRVLNRGEAVNALKRVDLHRACRSGAGPPVRGDAGGGRCTQPAGEHRDGVEHGADAVSSGRLGQSAPGHPPELIGRIAPTRLEGINLRGVFRFPMERYAGQLLPSQIAAKTSARG